MPISVVIPVLNEEGFLPTTLSQTAALGFDELIVVDGGSQDRTCDMVLAFASAPARTHQPSALSVQQSDLSPQPSALSPVALIKSEAGRARQMNVGAAASRGDILLFLHTDTLLPQDARSAIEQALTDPACVGGRFDVRFDRDQGLGRVISRMMNVRSRWTGIATGDQAIFVRRQIFERLGGFADLPLMEDVEFSRRLKRAGRIAALRHQVFTSYRRWEARGPWRTILLMWILRFLYWMGVNPHRLAEWYGMVR
jgi:rSAM/selenodomain-associated transferase 2